MMSETALVSVVALLGCLLLIWRSGALRSIDSRRKLVWAAAWIAIFALLAVLLRLIR